MKKFSQILKIALIFSLIIFPISYASASSQQLSEGLRDLESQLRGVNAINSPFENEDKNNECKMPLFGETAFVIGDGINTEEVLELFNSIFKPIVDLMKEHPAIGAAVDAYDIYEALTSADSWENFKEKIKEKVGEAVDIDLDQLEKSLDGIKKLWDDENEKVKEVNLGMESFEISARGECNTMITGLWQKSTGRLVLTAIGDCKCKKYNTGPFTLSIIGSMKPLTDKNDKMTMHTSYIRSTYQGECPCKKNVAYSIIEQDGLYTFLTTEKDKINEGLKSAPKAMTNLLNGHENIALYVEKKNKPSENIYIKLANEAGNQKIYSISKDIGSNNPTIKISSSDKVLLKIIDSPDIISALQDAFNTKKITISSTKLKTQTLLTASRIISETYIGLTGGQYTVSKNTNKQITYAGAPATLSMTQTNVRTIKTNQNPYLYAVNKYGTQIGYMTSNANTLLSHNSARYSTSAGIYGSPPPAVTTLGGYGYSGAFVVGGGTARSGYSYSLR